MLVGGGGGGGREEAVERRRPVDEGEGMSEDSGRSWLGGERKEESTLVETEGKAKVSRKFFFFFRCSFLDQEGRKDERES